MITQTPSSPTAPSRNEGTEGRALIGFMEAAEAIPFLRQQCYAGQATDNDLRLLHDAARAAAASQPYVAPELRDIEPRHQEHLAAVARGPDMTEIAEGRPWAFKLVEIDRIVAFQKFVDVERGADLAAKIDFDNPDDVLGFCLAVDRPQHPVAQTFDPRDNTFTLMTRGQDFRVLGNATMELPNKRRILGFVPGFGIPHVQVVHYQSRYFLKNGYHRLYQLRVNGVRHAPCIVVEAVAFPTTGAARDGFFPEALLMGARPPVMADFLHPTIAPAIRLRPMSKIIRIRAEEIKLPADLALPPPPAPNAGPAGPAPIATTTAATQGFEDFAVAREGWNAYRLEDGTVLKVRQLLLRIPSNLQPGVPAAQISLETSQPIIAVFPPSTLRGSPTLPELPAAELEKAVTHEGMKWLVVHEAKNEYACNNGARIELGLRLARVARTSRFAANGDPVYLVNTELALNVVQAPTGVPL